MQQIFASGPEAVRSGAAAAGPAAPRHQKADLKGGIAPWGYAKSFGGRITGFVVLFPLALFLHILTKVI